MWMAVAQGRAALADPAGGGQAAAAPQSFLLAKYGRLRTVVALDDHTLLVTTSNTDDRGKPHPGDDRILRITTT